MSICIIGFNGERVDLASATTHSGQGYRAYNPVLKRFHCPDSMSPFGDGRINSYIYCSGDPVNLGDPSGHMSAQGWAGWGIGLLTGLAGIALSVLTGGSSLAVAIAVTTTLTTSSLDLSAGLIEDKDPITAAALGWASLAVGLAGGIAEGGASGIAFRAARRAENRAVGVVSRANRLLDEACSSEQVNQWDRVATKGLKNAGGRLPGGAGNQVPSLKNLAVRTLRLQTDYQGLLDKLPGSLKSGLHDSWLLRLEGDFPNLGNAIPPEATMTRLVFRAGQVARGEYAGISPSVLEGTDIKEGLLMPLFNASPPRKSPIFNRMFSEMEDAGLITMERPFGVEGKITYQGGLFQYIHAHIFPSGWR